MLCLLIVYSSIPSSKNPRNKTHTFKKRYGGSRGHNIMERSERVSVNIYLWPAGRHKGVVFSRPASLLPLSRVEKKVVRNRHKF